MELELRLLDPETDLELFHEAYNWRPERKKHLQPDRMPFEVFASQNPGHIAVGAFTDSFLAVFFFHEYEQGCFEAHFTSRRGVDRGVLLTAAKLTMAKFLENGARELTAWIVERNRPLRSFVESIGFTEVARYSALDPQNSACVKTDTSLDSQSDTPERVYVKYAVKGEFP